MPAGRYEEGGGGITTAPSWRLVVWERHYQTLARSLWLTIQMPWIRPGT
jgi:hypothetical protein